MINIKTDSRKVTDGDTFVALRGISSDGHSYIEKAIELGATKIVAEEGSYSVETLIVPDTRKYLEDTLYELYKETIDDMVIIGLTGTNGKTTSAFLIYEALNKLDLPCAFIGTIGFYLGKKEKSLPNTSPDICDLYDMFVEAYNKGYKHIVLEVSSQGLAYGRFNKIEFDYAIFTNLTQDHLDYHLTMENYAASKQKLFKQLKNNGLGIVNIDADYSDYYKIGNYVTYGFNDSDYKIENCVLKSDGSMFSVNKYKIETKLIGNYNVYNILCAVILLDKLGINKNEIEEIVPTLLPPPGRMDIVKYNSNTIIVDYAHTPDAMENIYSTVKEIPHNNIYVVFGCTGSRDAKKRPVMMQIALTNSDYVVVTSDDLHEEEFEDIVKDMLEGIEKRHYDLMKDRYEAIRIGINKLNDNDILLILGKGHEDFIVVRDMKIPFNDKNEVLKILKEKDLIEAA
jgi:UDP-N-acetylmuramyl-tripeptide synthetase